MQHDMQRIVGGQTPLVQFVLLCFTFVLEIIGGIICGVLSYLAIISLFSSDKPETGISLLICVLVSVSIFIYAMRRCSLSNSLWKAVVAIGIASFVGTLMLRDAEFFAAALLMSFLFLCTYVFASITSSFSLSLFLISFPLSYRGRIKALHTLLIIILSNLVPWLLPANIYDSPIISYYTPFTRLLFGSLVGCSILKLSFDAVGKEGETNHNFVFLNMWATTLSSQKGTSFCNLDLSSIDFSGARLTHTDLRAKKLYRTCFQGAEGLSKARTDSRCFDFDSLKVQELITTRSSEDRNFIGINLQGTYLKNSDMRQFDLSRANLDGADLSDADLRESVLVGAVLTSADLSRADLTGACIRDWSLNSQTCLTGIECDYIYRDFENARPADRYPSDRNFKPGEFESLYQKVINSVELIFQDQVDWTALSFAFEKFQIEDDGMGLELKGVEQRGDYWIVKVTHGEGVSKQRVEQQVQSTYEDLRVLMEAKDQQIHQLLGIVDGQTKAMGQQAEALTNFSKHPFGNSFFISGSTITNLAGSGQIEYQEAASIVRQLVTPVDDQASTLRRLIAQLSDQNIATTGEAQKALIQQVLLSEAERDPRFKQLLLQQGQQIIESLPNQEIAIAFQAAIAQLSK